MKNVHTINCRLLVVSALLFLLTSWQMTAKNYYVDATYGNNTNDGSTSGKAFKTISFAVTKMSSGDVCYIAGGIYRETVIINKDNLGFYPLSEENVIITGTEVIKNWVSYKDGIYKADMSSVTMDPRGVTQVFFDKQRMEIARFPNNTNDNLLMATIGSASEAGINGGTWYIKSPLLKGKNFNDGSSKVWHMGGTLYWGSSGNKVKSHNDDQITFNEYTDGSPVKATRFFIYNSLQLVDNSKEWFYDKNSKILYFKPPGNKNLHKYTEVRVRENAFQITGSNNTLRGLFIYGATINVSGSGNKITRCKIHFPTPFFQQFSGIVREIRNRDDERASGVLLNGNNNTIEFSEIAYSWGDGVTVLGNNQIVNNCNIHDVGWSGTEAAGIYTKGSAHQIIKNKISELGRGGIIYRGTWNTKILNNEVYNFGYLTNDLGGIYTFETDGSKKLNSRPALQYISSPSNIKVEVAYNWVYNTKNSFNYDGFAKNGIYIDNRSSHINVHHNVVWNVEGGGFRVNYTAAYQEIHNNTFWNNKESIVYDHYEDSTVQGIVKNQKILNNFFNTNTDFISGRGVRLSNELQFDKNIQSSGTPFLNYSGKRFSTCSWFFSN